jgi:hypothetical protein
MLRVPLEDTKDDDLSFWPNIPSLKSNLRDATSIFPESLEDIICDYWMDLELNSESDDERYSNSWLLTFVRTYRRLVCQFLFAIIITSIFSLPMIFRFEFSWVRFGIAMALCAFVQIW